MTFEGDFRDCLKLLLFLRATTVEILEFGEFILKLVGLKSDQKKAWINSN